MNKRMKRREMKEIAKRYAAPPWPKRKPKSRVAASPVPSSPPKSSFVPSPIPDYSEAAFSDEGPASYLESATGGDFNSNFTHTVEYGKGELGGPEHSSEVFYSVDLKAGRGTATVTVHGGSWSNRTHVIQLIRDDQGNWWGDDARHKELERALMVDRWVEQDIIEDRAQMNGEHDPDFDDDDEDLDQPDESPDDFPDIPDYFEGDYWDNDGED